MAKNHDGTKDAEQEILDARIADQYAQNLDEILLDIADLNPEICPPDKRYFLGEREAWVYEHGNIAELVFVRTD